MEEVLKFESARRELEQQLQTLRARMKQVSAELDKARARLSESRRRDQTRGVHEQLELEPRAVGEESARLEALVASLERESKEGAFDEDALVQDVAVLREEEEKLMREIRFSGKGGGAGTDQFRRQASEVAALLAQLADVSVFDPHPHGESSPPLHHGAWDTRQRERQKEGREQIAHLRKELLGVVNSMTYYGDDRPNWSVYINKLEQQFLQALEHCVTANLQQVLDAQNGQGPELYSITLKLNAASRLAFLPMVNDVPAHIRQLADGVISAVCAADRLHCSLQIPADCDPANRRPLRELIPQQDKVRAVLAKLHAAADRIPDRAVEYVCRLEDDFKDAWFSEMGDWDVCRTQHAVAQLDYGWEQLVSLGGVCIDTEQLRGSLRPILEQALRRKEDEQRRASLGELELLDQSDDALAAHYSPPRLDGKRHVNPLLQNPPEDLEAQWQQQRIDIRDEFRQRERDIAAAAQRRDPPKRHPPPPQPAAPSPGAAEAARAKQQQQQEQRRRAEEARKHIEEEARARQEEGLRAAREAQERERQEQQQRRQEEEALKRQEERRWREQEQERQRREVAEMEEARKLEQELLLQKRKELAAELARRDAAEAEEAARAARAPPPPPAPPRPAVHCSSEHSLADVYRSHCSQHAIKPNSGVLRMLPKQPGAHMRELNLGLNYIGVKGIQPLLEVLRLNHGLQVLNLRDNNLENTEVRALVQVLLSHSGDSLTSLDISNNPISLAGGSALVDLLSRQRQLTQLQVEGTLVQPKILERIEEQLRQNRELAQQP